MSTPESLDVYLQLLRQHPHLSKTSDDAIYQIVTDSLVISRWKDQKKRYLQQQKKPVEWAEIGVLVDDPYVLILRDLVRSLYKPNPFGYIRILSKSYLYHKESVVILPWWDNHILLLRHYRHPTRRWHYEFPRGFGEPNLPPEQNAYKELYEEMGIENVIRLKDMGEVFPNTGLEGDPVRLFFAEVEYSDQSNQNRVEGIQSIEALPLDVFEEWIKQGIIDDGFTLSAYTRAKLRGLLAGASVVAP